MRGLRRSRRSLPRRGRSAGWARRWDAAGVRKRDHRRPRSVPMHDMSRAEAASSRRMEPNARVSSSDPRSAPEPYYLRPFFSFRRRDDRETPSLRSGGTDLRSSLTSRAPLCIRAHFLFLFTMPIDDGHGLEHGRRPRIRRPVRLEIACFALLTRNDRNSRNDKRPVSRSAALTTRHIMVPNGALARSRTRIKRAVKAYLTRPTRTPHHDRYLMSFLCRQLSQSGKRRYRHQVDNLIHMR